MPSLLTLHPSLPPSRQRCILAAHRDPWQGDSYGSEFQTGKIRQWVWKDATHFATQITNPLSGWTHLLLRTQFACAALEALRPSPAQGAKRGGSSLKFLGCGLVPGRCRLSSARKLFRYRKRNPINQCLIKTYSVFKKLKKKWNLRRLRHNNIVITIMPQ